MERMAALLDGEIPDGERAGTMEHLLSCSRCRAEWEASRSLQEALGELATGSTAAERKAVVEAAQPLLGRSRKRRPARLARWASPLGLAAALLLVALLVSFWPRPQTRELRSATVLTYHEYLQGARPDPTPAGSVSFDRGF